MRRLLHANSQRGFTLIELMVVVAIIGMMTAVVAVNTNAARIQSRDAKRKSDAANIAATLEVYFSEKRQYPGAEKLADGTVNPSPITSTSGSWDALWTVLFPTYISSWPKDPTGTDGAYGTGFVYQTNVTGQPSGLKSGSLYIVDVPLEEKSDSEVLAASSYSCNDASSINYYVTGIISCDSILHYRISSR